MGSKDDATQPRTEIEVSRDWRSEECCGRRSLRGQGSRAIVYRDMSNWLCQDRLLGRGGAEWVAMVNEVEVGDSKLTPL